MGRWARVCLMALAGLGAHAGVGRASSLDNLIPGLYGGSLPTTTNPGFAPPEGQPLQFGKQFKSLSGALAAARSQVPVPSASGAFRFGWDPELDTFVRSDQSLGSMFAERAQTLGRHTGTVSLAYTRIDFDSFEGTSLNNLRFSQPAVSPDQLSGLPPSDQVKFGNDQMRTRLNLGLSYDLLFLTAAFGVTDTIDASMALSINHAHMNGSAVTTIDNPDGTPGNSFFALNAQGQLDAPSGQLCTGALLPKCATDGFSESAWGTGDLFLRGKWHFYDTQYADLAAVATLTLPTGNANNLLGFYDPTFTPLLVALQEFRARLAAPEPRVRIPQRQGRQPGAVGGGRGCAGDGMADRVLGFPGVSRRQARRDQRRRLPVGGRLQGQPDRSVRPGRRLPVPAQRRRYSGRRHLQYPDRVHVLIPVRPPA